MVSFADGFILVAITGIGLWYADRQAFTRHYIWLVVAVVVGGLVVQAIKFGVARPRPLNEFAALLHTGAVSINVLGPPLRQRSFPSGHTQAMASVSMYLCCLYPRRWYWWSVSLLLMGLSRVYVGVHFPLDVLAGALLGSVSALGAWRLRGYVSAKALGRSDRVPLSPPRS